MGSLEVADVSMDTAYSKLEVMIRNFTREKLNLDNQINTLQRDIEVYAQALKEKDDSIKNLQIENGRYKEVHEDDEKIRLTLEAMVLSCEQKMKLLVDSLNSLQCSVEFNHEKYRDIMEFNQVTKKRQLFLKELLSRERANNHDSSLKLEKYEKWLLELQDNCNRQLLEKEALDTNWTERYKEFQASYKHLEEARNKDQLAHKDEMARQIASSEAKVGDLLKRNSDLVSEKDKLESDWKAKFDEMERKHAEALSSMELEKKALIQSFEEATNKDQIDHQEELAKQAQSYEVNLGDLQKQYSDLASEKNKLDSDWKAKVNELELMHSETLSSLEMQKNELIQNLEELKSKELALKEEMAKQLQSSEEKLADLQKLNSDLSSEKEKLDKDFAYLQKLNSDLSSEKEKLDKDWQAKVIEFEVKHAEALSSLESEKNESVKNVEETWKKDHEELTLLVQESDAKLSSLQEKYNNVILEKENLDSSWKAKLSEIEAKQNKALSALEQKHKMFHHDLVKARKKDYSNTNSILKTPTPTPPTQDISSRSMPKKRVSFFHNSSQSSSSDEAELNSILAKKTNGTLTTFPGKRHRSSKDKDPDFIAPKEKRSKHDTDAVQEKGDDGDTRNFTSFKPSSITTRKSPKKVY